MCGIAGVITHDRELGRRALRAMSASLTRRGPDDEGSVEFDTPSGVVMLGSRRLAIIDPSPHGHQPMIDAGRRTGIVYNGMIYNFRQLRARLEAEGEVFESQCDTEVILRAYGRWGMQSLAQLSGMFALAIWDGRSNRLVLARDRLGIKPLYVAKLSGGLVFASQVRAILDSGLVPRRLSSDGVASFLSLGAPIEPLTAIEGIAAFPAGTSGEYQDGVLKERRYWEFPAARLEKRGMEELAKEFRELCDSVVSEHLVADAPIGIFLSGGLDSSAVAVSAASSSRVLRTVSVDFDESGWSEGVYSDAVARQIGSDHSRILFRASDLVASLDDLLAAMDQPTFDGVNTFVVSRAARHAGLKVALSGLGADELLDGYGNSRRVRRLESIGSIARLAHPLAAGLQRMQRRRLQKLGYWIAEGRPGASLSILRSLFLPPEVTRLVELGSRASLADAQQLDLRPGYVSRATGMLELEYYTKNLLLRDTDSMSMFHSLEVRVPYLDQRLVDWSLGLPDRVLGRAGDKTLLRRAFRDSLPKQILQRSKHGFTLPMQVWLQRDLAGWLAEVVASPHPAVRRVVSTIEADRVIRMFEAGRISWHRPWALAVLNGWARSVSAE